MAVNVTVTGAAGQIGYALLFRIASGQLLGPDEKIRQREETVATTNKRMEETDHSGDNSTANRSDAFAVQSTTGCSSAWLERLVWDQEVASSNLVLTSNFPMVQR